MLISIHMTTVYLIGSGDMRMNYGFYHLVSFFSPIPNRMKKNQKHCIYTCWSSLQTGTWWTGVDKKKERKKRERAVPLGLRGKPIKPMNRTCTTHEGTGHPLKEVLKAWVRKWAQQVSMFRREWRQKEGCGGPRSLVEQGCFISRNVSLYIFSKMIPQLLERMKFHQLQQNG